MADILGKIPQGSKDSTVLTLCFADPFDIGLKFGTIKALSVRFVDFLLLLAVYSDANRAYKRYVMEDAVKVDEFLGSKTWRDRWRIAEANGVLFPKFLAEEFAASMETLGYLPTPVHQMKRVRSDEKNLPLRATFFRSLHSHFAVVAYGLLERYRFSNSSRVHKVLMSMLRSTARMPSR